MHYYVSLHPSGHRTRWLQIQYRQSESDVASQLPVGLRWNPSSCFTAVACQPFCFTSLLNKESKPLAFSLSLLQSCLRTACTLKKESRLTSALSPESENVVVSCSLLIQLLPWDEAQCMCVSERESWTGSSLNGFDLCISLTSQKYLHCNNYTNITGIV